MNVRRELVQMRNEKHMVPMVGLSRSTWARILAALPVEAPTDEVSAYIALDVNARAHQPNGTLSASLDRVIAWVDAWPEIRRVAALVASLGTSAEAVAETLIRAGVRGTSERTGTPIAVWLERHVVSSAIMDSFRIMWGGSAEDAPDDMIAYRGAKGQIPHTEASRRFLLAFGDGMWPELRSN